MIRVLIVNDHPMVRAGLRSVLNHSEGIIVVGECNDGVQVAAAVTEGRPDVALMDSNMPVMTGTTVTRDLVANHPTYRGG